jgi:hypothetical protein
MSSTSQVERGTQSLPHSLAGVVVQDEVVKIDVWDYFVEHIDEFPVAKSIVDYFDARPSDLHNAKIDVDVFGLYMRAKITLKRNAISYAESQQAIERAKLASKGLGPKIRAACTFCSDLRQTLVAHPEHLVVIALIGVVALFR